MQRLIDANELWGQIYKLGHKHRWENRTNIAFNKCLDAIRSFPTVEAEPVRHGRWYIDAEGDVRCTVCKTKCLRDDVGINILSNYCPHCGAKMDEALQWEEPEINPCRGCEDYDSQGGMFV